MGITVRADLEPERNLLKRTDHWPFMQIGVPAVSFLFGFDASDTDAAAAYRDWYENRCYAPQDDMSTPIDFQAQADFHRFYFALTEAVANAPSPDVVREESTSAGREVASRWRLSARAITRAAMAAGSCLGLAVTKRT